MEQRFTAIVQNDGNVRAIGLLDLTIVRNGVPVAELTSAGEPWVVQGGAIGPVEVVWSTTEERAGDYTALFAVEDVAGQSPIELGEREVPFKLEPIGTFTRSGVLADFSVVSEVGLDAPVVVEAAFTNTGEIETNAILEARLYRDDELVQVLQSLERATPRGETVPIGVGFEIDEPGPYRIEGLVNYDGFATETKSIDIEVTDGAVSGAVEDQGDRNVVVIASVGVLLLVLAGGLTWRRRRAGGTSESAGRVDIVHGPSLRTAVKPTDVPSPVGLDDPWFEDLDKRAFDPDLLAAAMAQLDAELGQAAGDRRPRAGPN
jgi:MYXO-CTERM domain-containing protein